ncbi:uncharacterized protein LOC144135551 isoform X1 [Amblyomma americanum]
MKYRKDTRNLKRACSGGERRRRSGPRAVLERGCASMAETTDTTDEVSDSTTTLRRTSTTLSNPESSIVDISEGDDGPRFLGCMFPGIFYVFLAVLVVGLVIFEYKTAGVRQVIFVPAEITPEVVAPAVLRSGPSVDVAATLTREGSTHSVPGARKTRGHLRAVTDANGSTASPKSLMRRYLWPFGATPTTLKTTTTPKWRPPASCFAVSVSPCDYESFRERAFYVTESSYGGFFCAEWVQHTHCPVNRDRFAVYSHCDATCKGPSGRQCDTPTFRLCTTEDKVYQFYYSEGQCQPLDVDEPGCLVGSNRFEDRDSCNQACGDQDTLDSRCRDEWEVATCAFDHLRYLYYYNPESRVCEMYNFCARSAFRTVHDCERACLQRRPPSDHVHAPTAHQLRRGRRRMHGAA